MTAPTPEELFWAAAAPLVAGAGVTRSTMMGLPCLRVHGQFFASFDRRTDNLVVKIPEARVHELIANGHAGPFTPGGRRFREWAAIGPSRQRQWPDLLDEALAFVADGHPAVDQPAASSDLP